MQPINNGAPYYPNCFDQLTTHGIVAEDVVGYITDTPSPYLQNYVAQRGWAPTLPGRVLPDPLPTMQPQRALPKGDIYQQSDIPRNLGPQTFEKPDKYSTIKKVALGVLLTGLAIFGIVKGRQMYKAGTPGVNNWFKNLGTNIAKPFKWVGTKISNGCKGLGSKIAKPFTSIWNKITKSKTSPTTGTTTNKFKNAWNSTKTWVCDKATDTGTWVKTHWNKMFKKTPKP